MLEITDYMLFVFVCIDWPYSKQFVLLSFLLPLAKYAALTRKAKMQIFSTVPQAFGFEQHLNLNLLKQ